MSTQADWIVVAGFLLAAFGMALRILIMMRSSDTRPVNALPKDSRGLVRTYRTAFPKSRLPLAMRISLYAGVVLLIAGLLLEFR
jgi:protein-S-isoprenylcysteine O-methyltransferase Ste14